MDENFCELLKRFSQIKLSRIMGNDRLWVWQFAPVDFYTLIDSDTPPHSMRIFAFKTFTNLPKTAKFVKVFTRERLPLYSNCCYTGV